MTSESTLSSCLSCSLIYIQRLPLPLASHILPEHRPPLGRTVLILLPALGRRIRRSRVDRPRTDASQADITRLGIVIERITPRTRNSQVIGRATPRPPPLLVLAAGVPSRRGTRRGSQVHRITAAPASPGVSRIIVVVQAELLLLVIPAGSVRVRLRAHARIPGVVRVERSEAAATGARGCAGRPLVGSRRGARVATRLEGADAVVDPADYSARGRLRGSVGRG
jgi:hypothetical protein